MKILFRSDMFIGGGAENVLLETMTHLCNRGHKIYGLFDIGTSRRFFTIYNPSIRFYRTSFLKYRDHKYIYPILNGIYRLWLSIKLRAIKFDIVIAFKEGEFMKEISEFPCKNKIGWIHCDYSSFYYTDYVFSTKKEELECMKKFSKIVCVSKTTMKGVINTLGNPGNLVVGYNPINTSSIVNLSKEKISLDIKRGTFYFVTIGRLSYPKNVLSLVKAVGLINRKYKFVLWVVGDGEDKKEIATYISSNNLQDKVKLFGYQKNPYPYIANSNVFVSSSTSESFGIAIQEALILKKPIIAVRCNAVDELLTQDICLKCEKDPNSIAKAMEKIMSDNFLYDEMCAKLNSYTKYDLYNSRLNIIEDIVVNTNEKKH